VKKNGTEGSGAGRMRAVTTKLRALAPVSGCLTCNFAATAHKFTAKICKPTTIAAGIKDVQNAAF
jgi:hypothetical protein